MTIVACNFFFSSYYNILNNTYNNNNNNDSVRQQKIKRTTTTTICAAVVIGDKLWQLLSSLPLLFLITLQPRSPMPPAFTFIANEFRICSSRGSSCSGLFCWCQCLFFFLSFDQQRLNTSLLLMLPQVRQSFFLLLTFFGKGVDSMK